MRSYNQSMANRFRWEDGISTKHRYFTMSEYEIEYHTLFDAEFYNYF